MAKYVIERNHPRTHQLSGNQALRGIGSLLTALVLFAGPLGGVAGAAPDRADGFEIPARDVYTLEFGNLRNPTSETPPDELLYNVAGLNLGVTWGEWRAVAVSSRAARTGSRTDLRLALQGLVPSGVYSVFYFTIGPDTVQPSCLGVERMLPVDAFREAGANSFVADASGAAAYRGRIEGDPLAAAQFFVVIVYHADGQTYYPFPNRGEYLTQGENCRSSFGHDAMRQVIIGQNI